MSNNLAKDNSYMKMVVNILRAGNIIDKKVSEALKEFDITHIQFNILRILEEAHPKKISVSDINKGLLFQTSDVTRLLDRLEKKKFISRTLCKENRRKMDLSINEEGLDVISNSLPAISEKLNGYYSSMVTEEERDTLSDVLRRLRN